MWKVNFTKSIIISLSIIFAFISCNEMVEGLPIKNGDRFASGGEVPALFQEMFDGKIVEIQYTRIRGYGTEKTFFKYTLNEKYTKDGEVCFELVKKMPETDGKGGFTGDTMIVGYRRTIIEIKPELDGVLATEYLLMIHGGPFGTGEPVDDDLYDFRTRGRECIVLYEKDSEMYTRRGYYIYDSKTGERIEWKWISNEPTRIYPLSPLSGVSYEDVKITRK